MRFISIVVLVLSPAVFAATTGTITLSGVVPAATAIVVTGVAPYNALNLSATQTDLNVATVREINNTSNGYKVEVSSANASKLKNGSIGQVSYTAKYNGNSVTLSTSNTIITNGAPSNSVVNVLKNFAISYTGAAPETQMAGTYSDTLTFTITAL